MTFDELYERHLLPILSELLEDRRQYNKTYPDVKIISKGKTINIKWYKVRIIDKEEKEDFVTRSIPYTLNSVLSEIERQFVKLKNNQ